SQETILKLQQMVQLEGKRVVVIGNGVVGRHVATLLVQAGAVVTVTIREYRRGVVEVPPGAYTINYSSRYQVINQADIVVSATTSNHFTVRTEDLAACSKLPEIVIDLAVPRDVEAQVGDMAGVTLLTVDDIASEAKTLSPESLEMIDALIKKNLARFANWNKSKRLLNKNALLPIGADGAEVTPRWSQAAGRKG
ncbi:MAG: hypothetical protein FWD45_03965, partial [Coriobacteriia bacterium]|nr:hypothetical protein [Coriobacteriia bacterium]